MRLDYTLYILAAILLTITVVPFVAPIGVETTETRSIWVVASVVLGLLSIGLGYTQRPRTEAQACQPATPTPRQATPEAQQATTMEAPKEETEASMEKPAVKTAPTPAASMAATMDRKRLANGLQPLRNSLSKHLKKRNGNCKLQRQYFHYISFFQTFDGVYALVFFVASEVQVLHDVSD